MDIVEIWLTDGTWVPLSSSVGTSSAIYPARVQSANSVVASMYSITRTGRLQVVQLDATSLGRTVDTLC
ncbi:hypothetical protein [Burkholderia ubonensis]|uniref:Uncharacterized protein n=1 Tax=Burkholderia ubonensis TaxID=101571 RepID=A0A107G190_9BURK|nr:hypothetical protein [Burkholderia ubonensis]KWD84095.1 hypothetical protein WL70_14260 [Burkholderia ubonensis]KWD85530.1 hypothetical protein WL71_13285 [Burkholderia ubonensis]KWE03200.1 hypothetical protein WL72_04750 [Burkholderia ubonensis]KWE03456.1 hypothetical protein WL73_13940 [Burkholderia ubonensis]